MLKYFIDVLFWVLNELPIILEDVGGNNYEIVFAAPLRARQRLRVFLI